MIHVKKEETIKIVLKGYVQGVGMRYFIKTHAKALGIKGYVQNNQDGSVTVVAMGYKKDIQSLMHQIKHQSPGDIDDLSKTPYVQNSTLESFTVRHP